MSQQLQYNSTTRGGMDDHSLFPLETIQVSLDAGHRVRCMNRTGMEVFNMQEASIAGTSFRELLVSLHAEWALALPEDFYDLCMDPVFLPWDNDRQPGLGWNLTGLKAGSERSSGLFCCLQPGLAPDMGICASEEGLADGIAPTLHHLLFRTRQTESRFQYFLRLLPGVPYIQNKDLAFAYRNEQLHALLGDELFNKLDAGARWLDWIHPEDRQRFQKSLEGCLSNRTPMAVRYRLLLPDIEGILYLLDLRIPVRSPSGEVTGYEGLWMDLTRQTLVEKRLQRSQWKESLAEITGSLSHDFNNILTGIVNLSNLMAGSEGMDPETASNDIRIINESAVQAQQLIQRIISLNREMPAGICLENLTDIVERQRDLIRIVLPRNIELSFDLPKREIPVNVDRSAIRRILMNFTTNARDAVGFTGNVKVILRVVDLHDYPKEHLFSSRCGSVGEAAELVFEDDGCGIDPLILHRIFSPYFSTKQASRGSGLGLYSLTQFAEEQGFDFGVRSELGKGTEMILLIPIDNFEPEEDSFELSPSHEGKSEEAMIRGNPVMRVGIYNETHASIDLLCHKMAASGIVVKVFDTPSNASAWLEGTASADDVFVVFLDHRKQFPEALQEQLRASVGQVRRVLCIRGFNPDEISHLSGTVADQVFEEHSVLEENLKAILTPPGPNGEAGRRLKDD